MRRLILLAVLAGVMYPNGLFVGEVDFGGGLLEVGHTLAGHRAYVGRIRDVECFSGM